MRQIKSESSPEEDLPEFDTQKDASYVTQIIKSIRDSYQGSSLKLEDISTLTSYNKAIAYLQKEN